MSLFRPNPATRQSILRELRETYRSDEQVAKRFGLPINVIRDVAITDGGRYKVSDDGLGRISLREFIVATKHVDAAWNNLDPKIVEAREAYDKGLVDIATGRDGFTLILYAFPRPVPDTKRNVYFARNFGDL